MTFMNVTFIVVVLVASCVTNAEDVGNIAGDFNAANCYTCSYYEKRFMGGGPRVLVIDCKKGDLTYSCKYRGNPHRPNCQWYNRKGNQPTFYMNLARKLGRNPNGACDQTEVSENHCPSNVFTKLSLFTVWERRFYKEVDRQLREE